MASESKRTDTIKQKESKFFVRGLFNAGKSSIVYRLKHGVVSPDRWSMFYDGCDVNFEHDGELFWAWDINGRQPERGRLLQMYISFCDGFVFVIDSSDKDILDDAIEELKEDYLEYEAIQHTVLMVVANKQDLENAMTPQQIEDIIKKSCKLKLGITVIVMPTSVETGEGLQVAFDYFWTLMKLKNQKLLRPGLIPGAWKIAEQQLADKNFEGIMKVKKPGLSASIQEKFKSISIVKTLKCILNV